MAQPRLERLLTELEAARYRFGPGDATRIRKLLHALDQTRFKDAASLIRFHEALMFIRAFPQNPAVLRAVEHILHRFHEKVEALLKSGAGADSTDEEAADADAFDTYEHSGIAGTTMEDTLSFDVARWLVRHLPRQVEIAWDNYEPRRELGTTGPRFMPLLEDDAFVEADTPFRRWLEAATAHKTATAQWLIDRFESLDLPPQQKAELYESLRIPLRWHLRNSPSTRTLNWQSPRKIFYHRGPLIRRSQVSLANELAKRPPAFKRLPLKEAERIANMIREVMLVRYRELYGTTLADPRSVVRVDLGGKSEEEASRGIELYLWNLPPDRRLPLRAYVAGFTLKNGVPINYVEAIGLCEWMEVGFNTFYTFRGGEAGWIYAQVLRALCTWMGTTVISVYPYQLGHENDEAIESGAFWFYRKLGFRPGRPELLQLVQREEKKIAANSAHRTPPRTLKRLAASHVFYEVPGAPFKPAFGLSGSEVRTDIGAWDTFSTRNIGLRINQRMAQQFAGDAGAMRVHDRRELQRDLGLPAGASTRSAKSHAGSLSFTPLELQAFDNFALLLSLDPQVRRWTSAEKEDLLQIIRAKSKPNELLYLHLTQRHGRLRELLLRLGS